ncbi:MAG: sugar phosphate nucleotidyltransferase [Bacteroidota bacterium]
MAIYAVIMAGGVGSRLWPRSRQRTPKQFLDVFNEASLIQNTFARLQPLVPPEQVYVVTNQRSVEETQRHLPAVPPANILAEPMARNTAPAIAFAAATLRAQDPDAVMIILSADHAIHNVPAFHEVLEASIAKAADPGALITVGIEPTYPETGYGYLQYDASEGKADKPEAYVVRTCAEKPDLATAERFLDSGDFLWNSGIFVWRADSILDQLAEHLPEVHAAFVPVEEAVRSGDAAAVQAAVDEAFRTTPKISIDYGVMEPAAPGMNTWVVPGSFGWSDVGDWRAVYDVREKDQAGNAVEGDVIVHNTSRSYVRAKGKLIVLVGVQDLAVVDAGDALLVCKMDATQQVKNIVDYLGSHGLEEYV